MKSKLKPPADLSDEAKAVWARVVKEVGKSGSITAEDRALLTLFATSWEVWDKAQKKVREEGAVKVFEHNGFEGHTKHYVTMLQQTKILRALLSDLKMTPASRKKVEEEPEELDLS